ncbi:AMP-binding protein [Nitrospirillum iridis]|uniref:Long-subunit acyl-CoA synthetase (AMP-forming) n=1 Tax=Nitrospirillum iridis TaxID=765888 RepID=A0A7X0ECK2_9PROT|nr:AMP-binding protein [Nitrospirillum iridis]MBB6251205.1 long-subunit acyl-CoA synthetase (AMP-forming) [Nitrospirillum iridis]
MHEVLNALHRHAAATPDKIALSDGAETLDYATLARRVWGAAAQLRALPSPDGAGDPVIGLAGGNRVDWVVGQLAAWQAGLTAVPLPPFFSPDQTRHILRDAGVTHVLTAADAAGFPGVVTLRLAPILASAPPPPKAGAEIAQIIYTSGSTGTPKGVCLGDDQLAWTAGALANAVNAGPDDHYLSAVPLALLLETLCAIAVPLLAGGRVTLAPSLTDGFGTGDRPPLAATVAATRPTCLVLVPHLLALWVEELTRTAGATPDSLRVVAVGGAAVPPALARRAWNLGIPVYEGYGLSECCSVVSLNRPGARRAETAGPPLPGLAVSINGGEIIVAGPPVMRGYLHAKPHRAKGPGVWRTGDHGSLNADGYLTVHGRLDTIIVTPWGRNVSPEWIESLVLGDPRVGLCLLTGGPDMELALLLAPSTAGRPWFDTATPAQVEALINECCATVPAYARPRRHAVVPLADLFHRGLLTGNGRIRRREAAAAYRFVLAPTHSTAQALP